MSNDNCEADVIQEYIKLFLSIYHFNEGKLALKKIQKEENYIPFGILRVIALSLLHQVHKVSSQ